MTLDIVLEDALKRYLKEFEPEGYESSDFISYVLIWLERKTGHVNSIERAEMQLKIREICLTYVDNFSPRSFAIKK